MGEMNALAPPHRVLEPLNDGGEYAAMVERTNLPHSDEIEQALLGALLIDPPTAWRACTGAGVARDDFANLTHSDIFGAISTLIRAGREIDMLLVHEHLRSTGMDAATGGLAYLNKLAESVPSALSAPEYARALQALSIRRRVVRAGEQLQAIARNKADPAAVLGEMEQILEDVKSGSGPRPGALPLLSLDQLREASESVSWLVKYVVPAVSMGMMFGGSGTFKSFIALDLLLHVAHGLPWMGRRTKKRPVLYIPAEGGTGAWRRIDAWHRARRLRWQDADMTVLPAALDLTTEAWRVVSGAQALGVTPALVVIDTLSQTYSGEENSANEMAAYLRELGARFRDLWQCAVLLIHHSGHSATERPRGSSAIRGNLDFMLGVFRDEKERLATVTCAKQKDGDEFDDATFMLTPMELGTDADGDRITSLVARHLSSAEEVQEAAQAEAKAGRGGRNRVLLGLLQDGMKERELRKAFYEDACSDMNEEARRQAYHRAASWAKKQGYFEVADGRVITLKRGAVA